MTSKQLLELQVHFLHGFTRLHIKQNEGLEEYLVKEDKDRICTKTKQDFYMKPKDTTLYISPKDVHSF